MLNCERMDSFGIHHEIEKLYTNFNRDLKKLNLSPQTQGFTNTIVQNEVML